LRGKFHPGKDGTRFRRHQITVTRQRGGAQHPFPKRSAAGRQNHRPRAYLPRAPALPVNPIGPADSVATAEKLEGGMMVENLNPGAQCAAPHEMHIVGAPQIGTVEVAVIVQRKPVAPFAQAM
jgi:hypothetical protein